MAYNQSYDGRVCQFNFAVTTPYLMQKGATFSSLVDDQQTLQRFLRFDGRGILDFGSVDFLTKPSTITAFDSIKQMVDESRVRAIQSLDVVHPI